MADILYCDAQARKLKETIFDFMEDNMFAVVRVESETVIFYNGLKISKNRNVYSIKDTCEYHEIDNLFLLRIILNHIYNAVKSEEARQTVEYHQTMGGERV